MVTSQTITAIDLWLLSESGEYAELIGGEMVAMVPPGGQHGAIQAALIVALGTYLAESRLGRVYGEVGYLLERNPDTVLAPDLSVIATDRAPADQTRYLELAPDLAVEIVSPGNGPGEIERKVAIYLRAGCRMVWVVYPHQRQVVVHLPGNAPAVFGEEAVLAGGDVLPGFAIPVATLFS